MKKGKYLWDSSLRIIFISLLLFVSAWHIYAQITLPSEQNPRDYEYSTFDDNWYHVLSNGDRIPFEVPGSCDIAEGETFIIEKTLPDTIKSNSWLCFRTSRQDISIYIDNELRESYTTKNTRPFGVASVSAYLYVELDTEDIGKTISVQMTSDSTYSGVMRSVLYGDKTGILFSIYLDNFSIFIMAITMLILSAGCLILTFIIERYISIPLHLKYLCVSLLGVSLWLITQNKMRQFIFQNISATSSYSEFILLLLPIPLSIYMDSIQRNRYRHFYRIFETISLIHFAICTSLIASSTVDQSDVNAFIYIFLGVFFVIAFLTILTDIKNKYIKEYKYVAIGLIGVLFASMLQLLQAFNLETMLNGTLLCLGFLFLLVMDAFQTGIDIIHAEKAKQDALAASEAKARFLASMSHEIRTPINAVLGIDELIARESNEENIKEYAEDIRTAGRSLLAIVNDILDFSKIESGKMNIVPLEYDLASVVNDSCSMMKVKSDEKDLTFETVCDETLPSRLYGDEVRIRQILINLLSNAIKYTNEGSVTLSLGGKREDSGHYLLEISVADTGIGIKKESLPVLFDSFSRVDDYETHHIEGTGLGLSIVKNLVELMHGTIHVESTYGKGSVFTVTLPQGIISERPIGDLSNAYKNIPSAAYSNILLAPDAKILVVDDIPINLKVFCGLLKDTMINIDTASSGREGLMKIRSNNYDMIFLDHMMPDLDGIEVLKLIKEMSETRKQLIPVIMLTANAILGAKEEYLQKGFDDYLSKPIQKEKLYKIIRQYLPEELLLKQEKEQLPDSSSILGGLSFLNTELGLSYHGGDVDLYLDIIKMIYDAQNDVKLQGFYEVKDWKNYQILIHSIKGSSKSIGAEKLSYNALMLENAAKTQDYDYILAQHTTFMEDYQEMLSNIREHVIKKKSASEDIKSTRIFEILVIDDDNINLRMAEKILEKFFHVTCLQSGKEALSLLANQSVDLILLDIHMPEMDGFAVLNELKANPATKDIPVIFLSADTDTDTEYNSFKAGAMDYIRKPFIPDIMLERINRILELDRLQQYLQDEVKKNATKAEKLSLQAMLALAQTIDAKDKYTKGHSTRVAKYSKKLAIKLGLSEAEQDNVYFMGLLHDIGKIGIPDSIINKPHRLTDEEFAIIKQHPEIGYDILKNFGEIPNIEDGARWHHEHMDGTGYPDGLTGDKIPKLVRIISVADAYDAMTSRRSYRDILPQSYIKEELARCKGKQFDSEIVEAMIQLIEEDINYLMNEG